MALAEERSAFIHQDEKERVPIQIGGGGGRNAAESESSEERESQEPEIRNPGERFDIVDGSERYVEKFRVMGRNFLLCIKQPPSDCANSVVWIKESVRDIHAYLLSARLRENDLIGVIVRSERFAHGPAGLSLRPTANFNHDDLCGLLSGFTQSNESFEIDDTFCYKPFLLPYL